MSHVTLNRARPDQSILLRHAISRSGSMLRQRSHLRAALNLKHADGVSTRDGLIDLVVIRQLCEIDSVSIKLRNQIDAVREDSHHSEAKQIDLNEVHISTIFFVPLNDGATWH